MSGERERVREAIAKRLYDRDVDAGHPPSFDRYTNLAYELLPDWLKMPFQDEADAILGIEGIAVLADEQDEREFTISFEDGTTIVFTAHADQDYAKVYDDPDRLVLRDALSVTKPGTWRRTLEPR